ncbi:MAG: LamG-like jellyroll fold domain-containing protein [Verrucomicrobiia bacterium]
MGSIPYSGIWSNGSQAGSGFGAWQLSPTTNSSTVFFFVGSSTSTDNGAAPGNGSNDINTAGVAWGLSASNGALASATRPFPTNLTSGQSFQVDMDNGYINSGGSVGFALQNSSGNAVWEYYFTGGSNTYTISAGSVSGSALPNFTDVGMHTTFTLTSSTSYSFTVLAYAPGGAAGAGTTYNYTGTLLNPSGGQSITSVRLFNYQAGAGTNYTAYFNNLSISGGAASDTASNAAYNTAGTTFRVWAPNATAVHVWGQWNGFSTSATPLYSEGNGNWSADVTPAPSGDGYEYYISNSTVGTNVFKQDPRSRSVANSGSVSYIYNTTKFNWAGDNFTAPGLSNAVIYELDISSFNDPGAPNNPGTFYTATNLLAFLQQVGVNVVEVMPVANFPGSFSWGYNPADPFAVASSYGGPDAFKTFVKTAHQYGIAVILDTVQNHWGGTDAPCYGDLCYATWEFDGSYSSSGGTNYGGIYFYQTPPCLPIAYTWGPRPDYGTPQVYQYIVDDITMWMNECHVDGFRWDSVGEIEGDYIPGSATCNGSYTNPDGVSLVTNCAAIIHSAAGNKINIGEDDPNGEYGYYGFDATWNQNSFYGLVQANLTASGDSSRNMGSISTAVNIGNNGYGGQAPGGWGNIVFTEDHDQCGCVSPPCGAAQRMPVQIDSADPTGYYARKRSTLGAALVLTAEGIPMLLSGQEMLTTNAFVANIPLNWSQTNTVPYSSILSFYTDMIRLRRNLDGRSSGLTGLNTGTIWEDNRANTPMIAYHRWNTGNVGDDVIVICNFANTNWPAYSISGFPHNGTWYVQLNSDWTKYSPDYANYGSSGSITVSGGTGTFSIAPYSLLVLSQNIPGAPPTPQDLTVTGVATNQITICWNVSSAATGYIVKRNSSPIATTSATCYTDTGLAVDVTYCYTVAATNNSGGVSSYSTPACATTLPATGATNLLAYWKFDEGSGTVANDSSGNTNTGSVVFNSGTGSWIPNGMVNGALFFDGGSAQVTVSNSLSLNPVNGITIAAWVNDASGGWFDDERILEKGKSDNQYALFANPSNQLEFLLAGVSNGTLIVSPPSSGAWHHLAATYDGFSSISLYIDGQLAAQQSASGALPVTTDPLAIGNKPGNSSPNYFFQGNIDDVRIYGSALPPAQIAQLYNIDIVGDGIPDWWRLEWFLSSSTTNNTSCATCDSDGTGQNNFFDYVAGLNPTDPTQAFTVQIAASNQVITLTFGPVNSTDTYTVQSSPDLVNYSALVSNTSLQAVGSNQFTTTDPYPWPSNEFYRIQISLPSP